MHNVPQWGLQVSDQNVYARIAAVASEIATTGIAKARKNQTQGYAFRGIDDVFNTLAPLLSKHKLVIIPRFLNRTVTERVTAKGGVLFYVTVEGEFDFVSVLDGSKHTARTFGEAMDSGDKATNKAMSAAYKYAAFQAFCIPTEGDNDSENTTHEVVATISDDERTVLADAAKEHGWKTTDLVKLMRDKYQVSRSYDLPAAKFEAFLADIRAKAKPEPVTA